MRRFLIVLITLFTLSMLVPDNVSACSCREVLPSEAYLHADVVALVRVEHVEMIDVDNPEFPFIDCVVHHVVTVVQSYKGNVTGTFNLESHSCDGASCGTMLRSGETYLIYVDKQKEQAYYPLPNNDARYGIGLCHRYMQLANAGPDFDSLAVISTVQNGPTTSPISCMVIPTFSGWVIACNGANATCFDNAQLIKVVDLQGRTIRTVDVEAGATSVLIPYAGLPGNALWAYVNECLVRLR